MNGWKLLERGKKENYSMTRWLRKNSKKAKEKKREEKGR